MKTILTYIFFAIILAPCMLIFNESDNFWLNIGGVVWLGALTLATRTKTSLRAYKVLIKANKQVECIIRL